MSFPRDGIKLIVLRFLENVSEIHFFGDKTEVGGNDYEIFADSRTVGHSVKNPDDTIHIINNLLGHDKITV